MRPRSSWKKFVSEKQLTFADQLSYAYTVLTEKYLCQSCFSILQFFHTVFMCCEIRVGTIGRDLIFLLTQCRHMIIDQQKSNTFLIRTSSNYFWASEVCKNLTFKSGLFCSYENGMDCIL